MLAVVSDSSPIIYLTRLGTLSVLRRLHTSVVIPMAVWREITIGGKGLPEAQSLERAASEGWLEIKAATLSAALLGADATRLGTGEIEAILLAKELQAVLLTDDADGRAAAEHIGIKVSGTVGILIRAKAEGHIHNVKSLLDFLLTETNFRMSDRLYQEALRQAGEQVLPTDLDRR